MAARPQERPTDGAPEGGVRLTAEQLEALAQATAAVPQLLALLNQDLQKITRTTEKAAETMIGDLTKIYEANDRAREAAEEDSAPRVILEGMQTVHDVAEAMLSELLFQDITRQVIEKVSAVLDDLGAEFLAVSDALSGSSTAGGGLRDLTTTLGQIRISYQSQLQRVIPDTVTKDVELF